MREVGFTMQKADTTKDNAEAQRLYADANDLKVRVSGLDAKIEQLDMRANEPGREMKKVGPSLKEVRDEAAQGMDAGLAQGSARSGVPAPRCRHSGWTIRKCGQSRRSSGSRA